MKSLAPIALFVYNRPNHLIEVINSLKQNNLSKESELFIFADGPKTEKDNKKVNEVRNIISSINGFKSVKINEKKNNHGLANSVIQGVTEILTIYDRIIVLEDDLITSPYFLNYMNDALDIYQDDQEVISIHGYIYPVKKKLPQSFFLKGADCWGWATWKRGWKLFENDSGKLINKMSELKLILEFDLGGAVENYKMLQKQHDGTIDSWAIRWHASAFLNEKLTLYPGTSFIQNIGTDGRGTHVGSTSVFRTKIEDDYIGLQKVSLTVDNNSLKIVTDYFRSIKYRTKISGVLKKITQVFNN